MEKEDYDFATKIVHEGQNPKKWAHRSVIPPICTSTIFQYPEPGKHLDFKYTRLGNPTRKCLEECLASTENAKYALCFSSGNAAAVTITHLLKAGDHIVCCDDVYGGINRYFRTCASKLGIELTFADLTDANNIKNVLKKNTKMVWLETPTNPTMKLIDIEAISKILKDGYPNVISVVDNTLMSCYFQKPLKLGADISMYSLTKYMNGHSDVLMGAIVTDNSDLYEKLNYLQYTLGCVPSPFDCYMANRGLKTLHLRMERHMENAMAVAKALECNSMVEKVVYPGLESHPQFDLAKKQCSGFSGVVCFYIKGGLDSAVTFLNSLKIFSQAVSYGCIESTGEIPCLRSHVDVPEEERKQLKITENLIRLSIGLESQKDVIQDIEQALSNVAASL